jgi:hypothetical protein
VAGRGRGVALVPRRWRNEDHRVGAVIGPLPVVDGLCFPAVSARVVYEEDTRRIGVEVVSCGSEGSAVGLPHLQDMRLENVITEEPLAVRIHVGVNIEHICSANPSIVLVNAPARRPWVLATSASCDNSAEGEMNLLGELDGGFVAWAAVCR